MNDDFQMFKCIWSIIKKQHLFVIFDEQTLNSSFLYLKIFCYLIFSSNVAVRVPHEMQNHSSVNVRRHLLETFQKNIHCI